MANGKSNMSKFIKKGFNKITYQDDKILKFLIESPKYGNFGIIVDIEDYDKIKECRWSIGFSKECNKFSRVRTIVYKNKKPIPLTLSNLIMNCKFISYKNDNIFDNRKENLIIMEKGFNKIVYQDNKIIKFLIESKVYGNHEVIIDVEDYDKVSQYRWKVKFDKKLNHVASISTHLSQIKSISLHQLIMDDVWIDHKNGNIFDNRKENLRKCTVSQNGCNRGTPNNNKSGCKGICWSKSHKKWRATISINNKQIHLGYFDNLIEAVEKYNEAAIKYHGEFAKLNIIKE